jgi:hypothetical protein
LKLIYKINELFDADSPVVVTLTDGRVEKGKIIAADHRMIGLEREDESRCMVILSNIEDVESEPRKKISGNAHRHI